MRTSILRKLILSAAYCLIVWQVGWADGQVPQAQDPPLPTMSTYLGIIADPLPESLASHLGVPVGEGLLVREVMIDSPAARADLARHDVLHKFGDRAVTDRAQLHGLVQQHQAGDQVELAVIRKGTSISITIELQARQLEIGAGVPVPRKVTFLGVATEPVPLAVARQLGLDPGQGMMVIDVMGQTPAFNAGIKQHDVLLKLGEHALVTSQQLRKLVREHQGGDQVHLTVIRAGQTLNLVVTLGQKEVANRLPAMRMPEQLGWLRQMPFDDEQMERLHELLNPEGEDLLDFQSQIEQFRRRMNEMMQRGFLIDPEGLDMHLKFGPGGGRSSISRLSDGEHSLTVKRNADGKSLLATDQDGNVLFDGPIDTDEQLKKVPAEIREKLKQMDPPLHEQIKPRKDPLKHSGQPVV